MINTKFNRNRGGEKISFILSMGLDYINIMTLILTFTMELPIMGHMLIQQNPKPNTVGVTADFTTHGGPHLYRLPYPSADSLDPMDHFLPLMFPRSSLKTPII